LELPVVPDTYTNDFVLVNELQSLERKLLQIYEHIYC